MKLPYVLSATLLLAGLVGTAAHFAVAQAPGRSPTRPPAADSPNSPTPEQPGTTGGLYVQSETGEAQFPLKHTEVEANVTGNVARVEVTQTFENPFDEPLEAVYVFPLPDEAAVDDMEIKIGDRTIRGQIKRREEAQAIYDQAVREGRTAGLLEQERANIFTQSLANIRPGEQIDVTIRYTESLQFEGGDYEFVFPMVVGPRYIPGNPIDGTGDTDQVPDASRITPPVLRPGTRSGHDIGVTVNLEAGVPIQDVRSPSHQIQTRRQGEQVQVQLSAEDTIPNKDLILRYRVSGRDTQATVLAQKGDRGGHFATYLIPAVDYRPSEIVPKDVVFLMDTSGSQSGAPLAQSKALMRRFIQGLNRDDTFTIIDFANTATQLSAQPLPNTPQNRQRAIAYIEALEANGGTELMNGIDAVMNFPAAPNGRLRSVVLITDGYIGNDNEVIAAVQERLEQGNRLYSFGVGSSVNRFLLDRLAEVGRGIGYVVRHDEPIDAVTERFFQQINNPVLTNIQVTWEGSGSAPDIYPLAAPDLFANQPLVLYGRKADGQRGRLKITGTTAGGQRYEETLPVNFDEDSSNAAIAQLWGRARIKDLMNQMYGGETTAGVEAITETALDYRLLSQYTAFVAVSEEVRVEPDGTRRTVQVPVELPEGVSYEGIFGANSYETAADMAVSGAAPMPQTAGSPQFRQGNLASPPASSPVSPPASSIRGSGSRRPTPEALTEAEVDELVPAIALPIEVLEGDSLPPDAVEALEQHLQAVTLPPGMQGELIFELQLRNGRVSLVMLDEAASSLTVNEVVVPIRRSLQAWRPDAQLAGTVRVKLRVNS